jgi:hypothetical protein
MPMSPYPSESMRFEYDIVVEAANGTRMAVVECKRTKETSDVDATALRRHLQAYLDVQREFFLFASPQKLFLWKPKTPLDARPDFAASAEPVLKEYLGRWADQPGGPLPESLQIAFSSWLGDLANGIREPDLDSEPEQIIVQSGLLDQIKGGTVRTQVCA